MKRRELLGAIAGSFALSITGPRLGVKAQERNTVRTINETAAERLRQVYSYVPNTPEYEALALGDTLWSDISKQLDAFGYLHRGEAFIDDLKTGGAWWFTLGNAHLAWPLDEPDLLVYVPVFATEQVLQLGGGFPVLTLFMGIDPAVPAGVFQKQGYTATSFAGGVIYVHAEPDGRKRISWNRFAVLLDDGVLAWCDSEKTARDYATWVEGGEGGRISLVDSQAIDRQLELVEFDAITMAWMDGSVFDVRTMEETPHAHTLIVEEEEVFGKMPQLLSLSVGVDAGAWWDPDVPAPETVDGYGTPKSYVKLRYFSDDDARMAAEIIEWRMKNAPSWREKIPHDFERYQPHPIDLSDVRDGVLIQRFGVPRGGQVILAFVRNEDPFLYGW